MTWCELARVKNAAGDEIILRRRNELFEIRYNGMELMSNLQSRSEEILAERALRLAGQAAPRVLIGGLGMGFTLRAALDHAGPDSRIEVVELVPEIVAWNRQHFGHLAGHPLDDVRVGVAIGDVMAAIRGRPRGWDVILMDTDNGPENIVRHPNREIYDTDGLRTLDRALRPGGLIGFWSATVSPPFERCLDALGWDWRRDDVQLPGGRADAFHHVYFTWPDGRVERAYRFAAAGPAVPA
jgi:spermidine synthase